MTTRDDDRRLAVELLSCGCPATALDVLEAALAAAEARGHAAGRAEERRDAVAWLREQATRFRAEHERNIEDMQHAGARSLHDLRPLYEGQAAQRFAMDLERGTHAKEEA